MSASRSFFISISGFKLLGPPTHPPWHIMPSMKSSGSLPTFMRSRAFLTSAGPLHLATLMSALSPFSFKHWSTAFVTPPPFPNRFPKTLASWLEFSSGSRFTFFARSMARASPKVRTKSALPSTDLSAASAFFAIHGPMNTVTVSGSFAFNILETAHIGETVVDRFSTSVG